MGLEQAIKHGKEHRKEYHGPARYDAWCRNHNRCWICRRNRLHKKLRDEERGEEMIKEENEKNIQS